MDVLFARVGGYLQATREYVLAAVFQSSNTAVVRVPVATLPTPSSGDDDESIDSMLKPIAAQIVAGLGFTPTATARIGSASAFGRIFGVDTQEGQKLAVKMMSHRVGDHMIQSSANMYRVASAGRIGPHFFGAFAYRDWFALVMSRADRDLLRHLTLLAEQSDANDAAVAEIGRQVDTILLRLASIGWTCRDLKPANFVVSLRPGSPIVNMIDVDGEFCKPHANMTADTITTAYLKMKATMELVCNSDLSGSPYFAADGPGLFGAAYRQSPEFAMGISFISDDRKFVQTVEWYTRRPVPQPVPARKVFSTKSKSFATALKRVSQHAVAMKRTSGHAVKKGRVAQTFDELRTNATPVPFQPVRKVIRRPTASKAKEKKTKLV